MMSVLRLCLFEIVSGGRGERGGSEGLHDEVVVVVGAECVRGDGVEVSDEEQSVFVHEGSDSILHFLFIFYVLDDGVVNFSFTLSS